jgi:alpha-tubulin suppressor-like RCC1 family protein
MPIVNYRVRFKKLGTSHWHTYAHALSDATTLTVTGLMERTTYAFQVAAINAADHLGPWTGWISAGFMGPSHSCIFGLDVFTPVAPRCSGSDKFGALGNGSAGNNVLPGSVSGLDGVSDNKTSTGAAGVGFSCVAAVGEAGFAKCWGLNSSGQLGDGTTTNRSTPVEVLNAERDPLTSIFSVAVGRAHGCAYAVEGPVWCWGANNHGQLGGGSTTGSALARPVEGLIGRDWKVVTGDDFTCVAARVDQEDMDFETYSAVECWGANDHGQLGDGTRVERHRPVQVVGIDGLTDDTTVLDISAGGNSVCVVTVSGEVLCWGANGHGQIGDGTTVDRRAPTLVSQVGSQDPLWVRRVSVGDSSACAISISFDALYCWGANDHGQLGDGTTDESHTPVMVAFDFGPLSRTNPFTVTLGGASACATVIYAIMQPTMSIAVYCWGDNSHGQLGDGTTKNRSVLTPVLQAAIGTTFGAFGPPALPHAPIHLAVSQRSAETLGVTWSPPTNTGGVAVTGYVVTWTQAGKTPRPADSATVSRLQTHLAVKGLIPGATYTFSVRAVNSVGRGAVATTSGIVPVRAPAPIVTSEVWKSRVITLTWEGVKTPAHSPVLGYSLSCQVDGGEIFRTKLGPSARTGSVTVDSDKLYSCRVAATTDAGRGLGSIRVTVGGSKGQGHGR